MNVDREVEFGVELPEDTVLVAPVEVSGHQYIGVAINVAEDLDEGPYRIALTDTEARDLHSALGAALSWVPSSEDRHVVDVDGGDLQPDHASRDGVPDLLGSLLVDVGKIRRLVEELVGHAVLDAGLDRLTTVINHNKVEPETILDRHGYLALKDLQRVDVERKPDRGLPVLDDEHVHDSSPSAGENAEPGQASTVSVEGEPATGGPFAKSPVAPFPGEHGREINPAALRSIRELSGVPSGVLAQSAGISHGFLSNIEAGRKRPSPTTTRALARRLGVSIDAITQTV